MKTRVCHKYLVNDCVWKQFLAYNLPQTPSNLFRLTNYMALRPLTQFYVKLQQLICEKALKFVFLDNYFPVFFHGGPNLVLKAF